MSNFKRNIVILIVFILGWVLLWPAGVYAVDLNGFSLGPPIIDKTIKPGESLEQVFIVNNLSQDAVTVEPYVQDYNVDKGKWNKVKDSDERWSPMKWATIESTPGRLGPGESGQILVKFNIPKDAEAGEHTTYFKTKFVPITNPEGESSAQIAIASELGSLVYIKVTDELGNLNINRSWTLNQAGTGFWHFSKPVFTIKAKNTGNVHLEVKGNIELKDILRNQTANLNVPLFNILPDKDKEIQIPWNEAPFLGYIQGEIQLTYDGKNFEERPFSFLIVPLFTLLGVILILGAVILTVLLYINSLRKRLAEAEGLQNKPKD